MSFSSRKNDPAFIYRITHIDTGRSYFGFTQVSLARRWSAHLATAKRQANPTTPLMRALKKYGRAAFRIDLVYEAADQREGVAVERALIAAYGTLAPQGFNLCNGGEGTGGYTRKHSAETKAKIAQSLTGRRQSAAVRSKRAAALMGRIVSQETRIKIAKANTGKRHSEQTRRKLRLTNRRIPTMETRQKQSRTLKGRILSAEHRRNLSIAARNRSAETLQKLGDGRRGKLHSDATKAKMRTAWVRRRERDGAHLPLPPPPPVIGVRAPASAAPRPPG